MKIYILMITMVSSSLIMSMQTDQDGIARRSSDIVIRRSSSRKNSISEPSNEAFMVAAEMRKTSPQRNGSPRRKRSNSVDEKKSANTVVRTLQFPGNPERLITIHEDSKDFVMENETTLSPRNVIAERAKENYKRNNLIPTNA